MLNKDYLKKFNEYRNDDTYSSWEDILKSRKWELEDNWLNETFLYYTDREDDYIADARKLTKKHEFDFEMIYKPILVQNNVINQETKLTLRLIDDLIGNDNLFYKFKEKTDNFLDTYKDIIDWYSFLLNNKIYVKKNIFEFTKKFKTHFNKRCWEKLTTYCYEYNNRSSYKKSFIKKYKDKLDWEHLTSNIDFDLDFIIEMQDYIKINLLFKNLNDHPKLMNQMISYTKNNLEEVLTYKKEEGNYG